MTEDDTAPAMTGGYPVTHLDALEAEAVHVLREVAAEFERPVILFSGDADSIVLLALAEKAFRPARMALRLLPVDTVPHRPEVNEFRDRRARELGERAVVLSGPPSIGAAIAEHRFDAVVAGGGEPWEPRPQSWDLSGGRVRPGEHVGVFPISHWTELDLGRYIRRERLELPANANANANAVAHRGVTSAAAAGHGDLLRIAIAGSVDDGRRTLLGRLVQDSPQAPEDPREPAAPGRAGELAHRHFATPRRAFVLTDTPGLARDARHTMTGAATADLAVVLLDARRGLAAQSRRHLFVASLLRIAHVVVCVNKMDLVGYSESAFEAVCAEVRAFVARLDVAEIAFVPVSALAGENVVTVSERMPWYGGPPLLHRLEHVEVASERNLSDVRLPVQWVLGSQRGSPRPARAYAGTMASGVMRVGDRVVVLPSGEASRVIGMERWGEPVEEGYPPLTVTVHLADDLDVSRGDMICRPLRPPEVSRDLDAVVCWMSSTPSRVQGRYLVRSTTRTVRGVISEVLHRIDVDTLRPDESASRLERDDIGRLRLRTRAPLVFDPYERNRTTGAFILIDESRHETVAAGMLRGSAPPPTVRASGEPHSANVTWQAGSLDRAARWRALGRVGATVWITGLPASGKSTLAAALERRLVGDGIGALRLDGDNLRHGLNGNLGFDPADRAENVRRTAHAARLLAEAGDVAIVSLVSPYAADRRLAREIHERDGVVFLEVFVDTPLAECERRDPKGLYARARAGELHGLTGVDDVYEPPPHPELRIGSAAEVADSAQALVVELRRRRVIP